MRLALGEESGDIREKVGPGAGWLPRVWELKWGRIWIPHGIKVDMNVDCGREGVDIVDVDVRVFPLCPPLVSEVQQLLSEEHTVRWRQDRAEEEGTRVC